MLFHTPKGSHLACLPQVYLFYFSTLSIYLLGEHLQQLCFVASTLHDFCSTACTVVFKQLLNFMPFHFSGKKVLFVMCLKKYIRLLEFLHCGISVSVNLTCGCRKQAGCIFVQRKVCFRWKCPIASAITSVYLTFILKVPLALTVHSYCTYAHIDVLLL